MAKATGKDYATINLDIWGNDDWLDLSPSAQHLYFVLWTSPSLSYCGTGEWHPGRISTKARGWTPEAVDAAALELSRELFLLIDLTTEEYILRSWIKHDGLWRSPTMSVSMANARAALASRTLRGVIVHEVSKLKAREPDYSSWTKDAVVDLLKQKAVDPTTLPAYPGYPGLNPTADPPGNPWLYPPVYPPPTRESSPSSNPPPYPPRTPAPAPTSITPSPTGGYVSRERHQDNADDSNTPPPEFCSDHMPDGTDKPCRRCQAAREAREHWDKQRAASEANKRQALTQEIADCPDCDEKGWVFLGDRVVRCPNHDWENAHA